MLDISKYSAIIQNKSNPDLADYYRKLIKRLVDTSNLIKISEIEELIILIRNEWNLRLKEGGKSSGTPAEGIMSTMGYRVGDTKGIKQEYRYRIIKDVLNSPLPYVDSPSYMKEWGEKSSDKRYNKLKRFLSGEINSPLQKNNYRAISEWTSDLDWLEKNKSELLHQI